MISLGELTGLRQRNPHCDGKIAHETMAGAEAQIASMIRDGDARTPERLRAYACRLCGRYHVGNVRDWPETAGNSRLNFSLDSGLAV